MLLKIRNREIVCRTKYKKIKHAYLKLNPNFQLEIILPKSGIIKAENLLKEKENWLKRKIKELENSVKLFDENTVYYKGKKYDIKVFKDKNQRINISENFIIIYKFGKRKNENILLEFLGDETLEYVSKKVEEFSEKFGLKPESISMKRMKSFGQCTKDGKIFFNSKLICLPIRLVDYVICHELIHLKHFNHSVKFKSELAIFFPEHKKLEKQLKRYYW